MFTGPTLDGALVREIAPSARVLPPAAHGDVLRAAMQRPSAIGIVDGVFDRVPAIWHKEVLWALTNGIAVYGASSMGALRARELATFGMRGVGAIYEAFARDELEDDDEVAILHADADDGYRALSDAMVDIRVTLSRACEAGAVSSAAVERLLAEAKCCHYTERRLRELVRNDPTLSAWVGEHHRSQKTLDAIEMVRRMTDDLDEAAPEPRRPWTLQLTQYWDAAYRAVLSESDSSPERSVQAVADLDDVGHVLDESRLDPLRHRRVEERALLSLLAGSEAQRAGVERSQRLLDTATSEGLRSEGVSDHDDLVAWLAGRQLADRDLPWIRGRWLELRFARRSYDVALPSAVLRELRLEGEITALQQRADRKRAAMSAVDGTGQAPVPEALIEWYFRDVLDETVPAHLDLWCKQHGWRDVADLLRALGREWVLRRAEGSSARPDVPQT